MKQINFSGSLVRVDCKTTPNYLNWEKNYRLVLHSILGVFRKTPKIEWRGKHFKLKLAPGGHFFLDFKHSGVFYNLLEPDYQKN